MTMPVQDEARSEAAGDDYGLTPEIVRSVVEALRAGDTARIAEIVDDLYAADAASLIANLSPDERRGLIETIGTTLDPEILPELDEQIRDEVFGLLHPEHLAAAVQELDTDDALDVIADLDDEQQRELLARLPVADRVALLQGLTYPEYSAGRLMQRDLVAVPAYWTVGETIDFMRASPDLPDDFYDLFVVDPRHRPVGTVSLSRVLRNRRAIRIDDIMSTDISPLPVSMDQEELARVFRQQDLVSAPVVDDNGRLVGVVTVDDVVDVIDEEAEDDLMKMGGVLEDDLYRAAFATARSRSTWLAVNICTAFLAATVISLFEATIQAVVALAVLMPIVASMGGNAATQTLTVAVRALATRELSASNAMRIVWKETVVGMFNGVAFAILVGLVAFAWFHDVLIGVVIAAAMVVNLVVAGFVGVVIPVVLDRLKIDPAIAASIFVTMVTDVVGFLAFLGLGTLVLL